MHSQSLERSRPLNQHTYRQGGWVYWMSRDQRVHDNWALLRAADLASEHHTTLSVVFCLVSRFAGANQRHYDFMLRGLEEMEHKLASKNIPLVVLSGPAPQVLPEWVQKNHVGGVITDYTPLRIGRSWRKSVADSVTIPVIEVDTHNIVPVWLASQKLEVGARTLRPKIHRLLPQFLSEFPPLPDTFPRESVNKNNWQALRSALHLDASVQPVTWLKPGEQAAHQALEHFIDHKATGYAQRRNDPNADAQSDLSPYLHYGQLSAQRVALRIEQAKRSRLISSSDAEAYLEELIVRRELADNFCHYQPQYDRVEGFPTWAQASLSSHLDDPRPHLYSLSELEEAKTADELWNASQRQLVRLGKMHGYLRMYWAKKILEWSPDPQTALTHAIYLNDTYELDGRDPNGYTGVAWSIGGVHDRPWFDRPIYGLVRYMNRNGANKKFDTKAYIAKWS